MLRTTLKTVKNELNAHILERFNKDAGVNMTDQIKERGAASVKIELANGSITVTHGTAGEILKSWTAEAGDWERIWDTLNSLDATSRMSDALKLTAKLIEAGADRAQVISIVDGYGNAIDWSYYSLDSIIGEVWNSDLNSGDDADSWIINEICRAFNVQEVSA